MIISIAESMQKMTEQIYNLKSENEKLKFENELLKKQLKELIEIELQLALKTKLEV